MSVIKKIFENRQIDEALLKKVESMNEPATKYIIAMTPRSGSSHLCDVIKNTCALGKPGEQLAQEFIPNILSRAPARDPDEYFQNVLKVLQSDSGVSGLKTSWFQFKNFCNALDKRVAVKRVKYIYLTRRDMVGQAVSLYKATESSVFHTNKEHSEDALKKLDGLEYSFEKIDYWLRHIAAQEAGWMKYFSANNIFPLYITYEDINNDVVSVVKRIAAYLGIKDQRIDAMESQSVFRKIGDHKNIKWACRYTLEAAE